MSAQARHKIGIAVIGASGVADSHIRAIQRNRGAHVLYLCSRDLQRARKLAGRYRLKLTDDYPAVLRDKAVSAIDIITEPGRHADLAAAAMKAGKHVLIEKPLDADIHKAQELLRIASASGAIAGVVSQKRFEPGITKMRRSLDAGVIGKPYFAEIRVFSPRTTEYYRRGSGWRNTHGGVLFNHAIHWIDIAVWFFGMPETSTGACFRFNRDIGTYDTAVCNLRFAEGFSMDVVCSTYVKRPSAPVFRVYGPNGILDYESAKGVRSKLSDLITGSVSGLQRQIDDFIEAVIVKRQPSATLQDGYNCLKVVHDCEASLRCDNDKRI